MEKLWFLFLLGQSTGPVGQNGLHMLLRANENMVGLDLHNERIRKLQDLWQSRTTCKMSSKGTKRQRVWTRLHFFETESDRFQADTWKCTGNAWFWRQAWEAPQTESIWVYKTEPHRVRLARNMAATVTEWAWMCGLLLLDFMRQIFWINQLMGAHWSIDPLYVHGFPRYIHLFWLSQIKRSSPRPTGNRQRQLSSTR